MSDEMPESIGELMPVLPASRWVKCKRCGGDTPRHWDPCWDCQHPKQKTDSLGFERTRANIPERFQWAASLDDHMLRERVKSKRPPSEAHGLIDERYLVLVGPATGVGKTSLAAALLHEWARKRNRFAMWVAAYRLGKIRGETPLGREPQMLSDARDAPLVLIDDLGSEPDSPASDVRELITARTDADRPLWVTTAFEWPELSQKYGEHIARRVYGNAKIVRLGPSQLKAVK